MNNHSQRVIRDLGSIWVLEFGLNFITLTRLVNTPELCLYVHN